MICVRDFVVNLSRTLSQSQRNGIWAYLDVSWVYKVGAGSCNFSIDGCKFLTEEHAENCSSTTAKFC